MTSPRLRLLGASLFAATTAACGNLDGHTETPGLLATVQGELQANTDTSAPIPGNVHIAVIWETSGPGTYRVAEDLPVQPVFPSRYTLDLRDPPPDAAIEYSMGDFAGVGAAYGVIVAYQDLNGDGQLDLVDQNAKAFVDRIVASNTNMALVYITSTTGSLPSAVTDLPGHPGLGYSLLTRDCIPVDGGDTAPDGGFCDWNVFLPIDTSYDLPFSDDPKLASLMCSTPGSGGGSPAGGEGVSGTGWDVATQGDPPGGYPAPGASGVTCNPGNTSYLILSNCVTTQEDVCGASFTQCTGLEVGLYGAPKPAAWPCP